MMKALVERYFRNWDKEHLQLIGSLLEAVQI